MRAASLANAVPEAGAAQLQCAGSAVRRRYLWQNGLLATAWDEAALHAEIDRMAALLAPVADPADGRWAAGVDDVHAYVTDRRAALVAETMAGPAAWTYPPFEATCLAQSGTVTVAFATTWDTVAAMNPFATGTATLDVQAPGVLVGISTLGGAAAGDEPPGGFGYRHTVMAFGALPDGKLYLVYMLVPPETFVPGATVPIDWQSAFAVIGDVDTMAGTFNLVGYLNAGMLHFDEASTVDGAPVSGTITADLLGIIPAL